MSAPSWHSATTLAAAAVGCCSLAYPAAVYAAGARVPPMPFILLALVLLVATIGRTAFPIGRTWRGGLVIGAVALIVLAIFDERLAARAYPVILGLGAAGAFGFSLTRPPSMIERFARLRQPDLPLSARTWCQKVTWVWTIWLVANVAIATYLSVWGDDRAWALWTGLFSYLGMAALLAGEWLVRPRDASAEAP